MPDHTAPPISGAGLGWRPALASLITTLTDHRKQTAQLADDLFATPAARLDWVEVVAESVTGPPPLPLTLLIDRGVPVVPHGIRLSLGSPELDVRRVNAFVDTTARLRAPLASEHIAFTRAHGVEAGHLMPLPRTRQAARVVAANARRVATSLDCPLALENIASFIDWPDDELTEAEFVTEVLELSDCLLVLDIANVYANARNRGADPTDLLAALPLDRLAYVHVAGGRTDPSGLYHDTHTAPVPDAVFALLADLARHHDIAATLLERDGNYPPPADVCVELSRIEAARLPADVPGSLAARVLQRSSAPPDPGLQLDAASTEQLTEQQSRLISAVTSTGPVPPGFAVDRVDAAAAALLRKRSAEVAAAWPALRAALGTDYADMFSAWARRRPTQGALADGHALACAHWDLLDEPAHDEVRRREATLRFRPGRPPRRQPWPRLARLATALGLPRRSRKGALYWLP